jgi:hypothetical protein
MKYLLLLLMVGISYSAVSQSRSVSVKAIMQTASGVQKGKLRNVYGIGGAFESRLKKISPLRFTAALDLGINGIKNQPYDLDFNGYVTSTRVHYTSYVVRASAGLKYIFREEKLLSPYAAVSAGGLNYYTSMSIEDPDDPDGCSPMETKPVSYSLVFAGTAEAGLRYKIRHGNSNDASFIEAGAGYLAGTKGRYLRLEKKPGHNHSEDDYMMKFTQNSTGQVHDHPLGSLYRTAASQLAFHIGYVYPL